MLQVGEEGGAEGGFAGAGGTEDQGAELGHCDGDDDVGRGDEVEVVRMR